MTGQFLKLSWINTQNCKYGTLTHSLMYMQYPVGDGTDSCLAQIYKRAGIYNTHTRTSQKVRKVGRNC